MKFGIRTPSLRKRIAARTSLKRQIRQSLGFKAPRGWGWLSNPRRATYNRAYNRATVGCVVVIVIFTLTAFMIIGARFIVDESDDGKLTASAIDSK